MSSSTYGSRSYEDSLSTTHRVDGPTGASASSAGSSSTTGVAKEQAAGVASDAQDAGKHVAGVAKDQATDVVGQARRQASDLLGQGRSQLKEQSTAGQQRAASGLSAMAAELKDLADGKGGSGIATDLAHQASQRIDAVSSWLGEHEPADILREVQTFARRRPVAFLAIAAGAGLVAGRLTRGLAAAGHDTSNQPSNQAGGRTHTPSADGAGAPATGWTIPDATQAEAQFPASTAPTYGDSPATSAAPRSGDQSWNGPLR